MLVVAMTCRRKINRKIKTLKPGIDKHIPINLGEQGGRPRKKFTISFTFITGLAALASLILYLLRG